ncbi:MAG TPA: ATP-binding protein [Acidobacteriaceae bacterium]|jgi:heavy metal sensor kinase|nr:ATP-binding protein [Acidobacteriaceae bacterium]
MKQLPIRLRLTLWYFAVFSCAGIVLCVVSWFLLQQSLKTVALYEMGERIDDVHNILNAQPQNITLDSLREQFSGYNARDDGKWLQILDQNGNWLFRSERIKSIQPTLPLPQTIRDRDTITKFAYATRHHPERSGIALIRTITVHGRLYSVQTGLSQSTSAALLETFARDLVLLTPGLLFLAAILGYWMSRKALSPIAELALRARQISDKSLNLRLPVSDTNDEVSHLSETLNQMLARIDSGVRSIREFTANAAHELRTPLALIRTEVEVILSFPRSKDEYRESYANVQQETIRMTRLIDDLLMLARTDAGVETLHLEAINVTQFVHQIGRKWGALMQQSLLEFDIEVLCTTAYIAGDLISLQRLMHILLENACRCTPAGGSIKLRAFVENENIVLEVSDTGIGIAAEHLPRIFERFYRVDQARSRQLGGSGLGLALAKLIAAHHRATLTVASDVGAGTRFRLTIEQQKNVDAYLQENCSVLSEKAYTAF